MLNKLNEAISCRALFFIIAFYIGLWTIRIPTIKDQLHTDYVGIGYILEGEASYSYTTTEVSGFRYISFLRKSFGKWALMLGYQVNSYAYNYNSPIAWESKIQTQLDTLSKQNIFMLVQQCF